MAWQVRIEVTDVSGAPVPGAVVQLSTRGSTGGFDVRAPTTVAATVELPVADAVVNAVMSLSHPRFAPLVVNLVRGPQETGWRWTEAGLRVATQGQQVTVAAVLSRVRLAPLIAVPEADLVRRAEQTKAPLDAAARNHKHRPPNTARIGALPGMLRDNQHYRHSGSPEERAFHILAAEPLGDARQKDWPVTAPTWGRFATTVHPAAPGRSGRLHMFEYGEIGTTPTAPRLLVAVWLPHQFARVGCPSIDFLVWFTPNTNPPNYPEVEFPFRGDYPYVLMAHGTGPYSADQSYAELGFAHMLAGHRLAYQMEAAQRAAAIVVPIAPSAHFELWESPSTLMRMLKEICHGIPRDDDARIPKFHPPPPSVGRVGVAGFSAAGRRLSTLLDGPGADAHYRDAVWGTDADRRDFAAAWRELWCIDGNFGSAHSVFLDKGARWVRQQADRLLRIYKNDFTDGRWDPRAERGEFGRAMRQAVSVQRTSGADFWAVHSSGLSGQIQALSMSKRYALSPNGADMPPWDPDPHENIAHENMPLICFGHAATTSRFGRLESTPH